MSELKQCPFCGGKANLSTVGRSWYRITANHSESCLLEGQEFDAPQTDDQLPLLLRDWNNRAALAQEAVRVEAVRRYPDSPGQYYNGCPPSALSDPIQCWRDGYACGFGNASTPAPVSVVLSDEQILEVMRPAIYRADGGYVFDTAKDDVIAAGRALLDKLKELNQ